MAATKRATPPTHVTVWIGLGMAAVGLFVALYAYTGTRVYDVVYAVVALAGGLVALVGILVSAWGRSVMAARASRSRRSTMQVDTLKLADEVLAQQPPTVAEPASKKKFDLKATARRMIPLRAPKEERAEKPTSDRSMFAFSTRKERAVEPPPPAPPAEEPLVSLVAAPVETPVAILERVTLVCPECSNQFSAEGTRPFVAVCPSCSFSADVP